MRAFFLLVRSINISLFSIPTKRLRDLTPPCLWRLSSFFYEEILATETKGICKIATLDISSKECVATYLGTSSSHSININNNSLMRIAAGKFTMQLIWLEAGGSRLSAFFTSLRITRNN